jgi:hypothetical protein
MRHSEPRRTSKKQLRGLDLSSRGARALALVAAAVGVQVLTFCGGVTTDSSGGAGSGDSYCLHTECPGSQSNAGGSAGAGASVGEQCHHTECPGSQSGGHGGSVGTTGAAGKPGGGGFGGQCFHTECPGSGASGHGGYAASAGAAGASGATGVGGCGQFSSPSQCAQCCRIANPTATVSLADYDCACAPGAACSTECNPGSAICGGAPDDSDACVDCFRNTLAPGGACATDSTFQAQCLGAPACAQLAACLATCP